MTEDKVSCVSCGREIRRLTAERHDGMCAPCHKNSQGPSEEPLTPSDLVLAVLIIVAPSTLLWFLSFETLARWWGYASSAFCLYAIGHQFWMDNCRTEFFQPDNRSVLWSAFLYWIPIFVLIVPGIIVVHTVDTLIGEVVAMVEVWTHGVHQEGTEQLAAAIEDLEAREYRWWWPADWPRQACDGAKLETLKTIQQQGASESSFLLHAFWSLAYLIMNTFQTVSWCVIVFLLFRSFIWIWVRTWLSQGGSVRFTLASKNA